MAPDCDSIGVADALKSVDAFVYPMLGGGGDAENGDRVGAVNSRVKVRGSWESTTES